MKTYLLLSMLWLLVSWRSAECAQPAPIQIVTVDKLNASTFQLTGQGFTGTSKVNLYFDATPVPTSTFAVLSDTTLNVTASTSSTPQTVVVFAGSTLGVGFQYGNFIDVADSVSGGPGSEAYLIHGTGHIQSAGFGSSFLYLQSGATVSGGGGGNLVFVEPSASYSNRGGGSNTAYYINQGDVVFGGGGGNLSVKVDQMYSSIFNSPVPEPSTAALLLLGILGCFGRRR
jgi:hypothetical protein